MPVSQQEMRDNFPLAAWNYRVDIGQDTVAFSEVSGLSMGCEVVTYKESRTNGGTAGPRTMLMPAQATNPTITLKKGVVRLASIKALYSWIASTQANVVEKKDISVSLCDEEGNAVLCWKVINAFPVKLDAPAFSATSNEAAIESMELRADNITMEAV